LSKYGRSVYRSTHEQLQRFTEYFAEVFSGESLTLEQQQHMEQLIQQVETLLQPSIEGNAGDTGDSSNVVVLTVLAAVVAAWVVRAALPPYRRLWMQ